MLNLIGPGLRDVIGGDKREARRVVWLIAEQRDLGRGGVWMVEPTKHQFEAATLDADLYVPALLEGVLGSRRWIAVRLGASGGKVRSVAKAAASRENGKRGGRLRKGAAGTEAEVTRPSSRRR